MNADANINIDTGKTAHLGVPRGHINIKSSGGSTSFTASKKARFSSSSSMKLSAQKGHMLHADDHMKFSASSTLNIHSSSNVQLGAENHIHVTASENFEVNSHGDLHVKSMGTATTFETSGGLARLHGKQFQIGQGHGGASDHLRVHGHSHVTSRVLASDFIVPSDRRLKRNVHNLSSVLPKLLALRGVTYRMLSSPDNSTQMGLLAQDLLHIFPEVVHKWTSPDDGNDYLAVDYSRLTSVLVEGVKEMYMKRKAQNAKLDSFTKELQNLMQKL